MLLGSSFGKNYQLSSKDSSHKIQIPQTNGREDSHPVLILSGIYPTKNLLRGVEPTEIDPPTPGEPAVEQEREPPTPSPRPSAMSVCCVLLVLARLFERVGDERVVQPRSHSENHAAPSGLPTSNSGGATGTTSSTPEASGTSACDPSSSGSSARPPAVSREFVEMLFLCAEHYRSPKKSAEHWLCSDHFRFFLQDKIT